jgi:agmatinase
MSDTPGIVGQTDGLEVPRFAGLTTFARLPRREDVTRYDVAVVGVPFDTGVTYRPGARFGPAHIRQSSRLLRPYNPSLDIEPFRYQQVVDAGDIICNPFNIDEAISQIEAGVLELTGSSCRRRARTWESAARSTERATFPKTLPWASR